MALWGSTAISVEIKSSAYEFYNLWKSRVYHLPDITGGIQNVEVHEGDWHWHVDSTIKLWSYTLDGKAFTMKEKVSFDNENKSITCVAVDGDLLKEFKNFKLIMKVIPKADGKSVVSWTIDYEKLRKYVVIPVSYLVLNEILTRDDDDHLLSS